MKQQKMLLILFALLILILFSACTKTVYVDRPIEVEIPVKCKVPHTACEVEGSDAQVVIGLTKCIVDLKEAQKVCQ